MQILLQKGSVEASAIPLTRPVPGEGLAGPGEAQDPSGHQGALAHHCGSLGVLHPPADNLSGGGSQPSRALHGAAASGGDFPLASVTYQQQVFVFTNIWERTFRQISNELPEPQV